MIQVHSSVYFCIKCDSGSLFTYFGRYITSFSFLPNLIWFSFIFFYFVDFLFFISFEMLVPKHTINLSGFSRTFPNKSCEMLVLISSLETHQKKKITLFVFRCSHTKFTCSSKTLNEKYFYLNITCFICVFQMRYMRRGGKTVSLIRMTLMDWTVSLAINTIYEHLAVLRIKLCAKTLERMRDFTCKRQRDGARTTLNQHVYGVFSVKSARSPRYSFAHVYCMKFHSLISNGNAKWTFNECVQQSFCDSSRRNARTRTPRTCESVQNSAENGSPLARCA